MNAVEPEPMGVRHVAKAAETRDTWELGMTIMIYGMSLGGHWVRALCWPPSKMTIAS